MASEKQILQVLGLDKAQWLMLSKAQQERLLKVALKQIRKSKKTEGGAL